MSTRPIPTQTADSPASRVWTVRAGTTGQGMDLFHVYAADMDSARASAEWSAEENWAVGALVQDGFTVHADVPTTGLTAGENPLVSLVPAPDFPVELEPIMDVVGYGPGDPVLNALHSLES